MIRAYHVSYRQKWLPTIPAHQFVLSVWPSLFLRWGIPQYAYVLSRRLPTKESYLQAKRKKINNYTPTVHLNDKKYEIIEARPKFLQGAQDTLNCVTKIVFLNRIDKRTPILKMPLYKLFVILAKFYSWTMKKKKKKWSQNKIQTWFSQTKKNSYITQVSQGFDHLSKSNTILREIIFLKYENGILGPIRTFFTPSTTSGNKLCRTKKLVIWHANKS